MSASRTILVIDDEDDIREVIALSLESMEWRVRAARSADEGHAMAAREHPDAILLDVMMPGKDGVTKFRELRDDPATRGIPVILLTAKLHPADRREFDRLDVAGVIGKPFDPLRLGEEIAAMLGWRA